MKKNRSKLEMITSDQIEEITEKAEKRTDVPRISSRQVNMRIDGETLGRAKRLAETQGIPYTTYLMRLLKEDIERLWEIYKKTG